MTTLLLDTHTYVWALTDSDRSSSPARQAMETPTNELRVSAATAWEMAIKHQTGRWPEADRLLQQHDDPTDRLDARRLEITASAAIRAGGLDWDQTDPFDRMLAAQALLVHAALVTRDGTFQALRGILLLW